MKARKETPPSDSWRVRPGWPLRLLWRSVRRGLFGALSCVVRPWVRESGGMPPASVLLVRDDRLGDALLATPMVEALRRAWPETRLTVLASPVNVSVFERLPEVDRVLVAEPGWHGFTSARREIAANGPFELAIDLHSWAHLRSALLLCLARIPRRVGHDADGRGFLLTRPVALVRGVRYEAQRNLDLLPAVGIDEPEQSARLRFVPEQAERQVARDALARLGIDGGFAVLHPGTGLAYATHRRLDSARLAEVARGLVEHHDLVVIVSGGAAERDLVAAVVAAAGRDVIALDPPLSLGAFAAVLEDARLVVVPDTGVLHLAVALGAPTVAMLGPKGSVNGPGRILPPDGSVRFAAHDLGCSAERCDLFRCASAACMGELTAAEILAECEAALGAGEVLAR